MTISKKITEKVLAANRENAKKSPGPRNNENSSQNARVHGLLSRKLRFESDEERALFDKLVEDLCADRQPCGHTEYVQVFEMAFCLWNLQTLYAWLVRELVDSDGTANAILKNLQTAYDDDQVSQLAGGKLGAAGRGWDCQELVVRAGNRTSEGGDGFSLNEVNSKAGQLIVDAKMTRTVDLVLRYTAAVKRDYYRALGKLQELQRERFEQDLLRGGADEI